MIGDCCQETFLENPNYKYDVIVFNRQGAVAETFKTNNWNKTLRSIRRVYGAGWIVRVIDAHTDYVLKTNVISKRGYHAVTQWVVGK